MLVLLIWKCASLLVAPMISNQPANYKSRAAHLAAVANDKVVRIGVRPGFSIMLTPSVRLAGKYWL